MKIHFSFRLYLFSIVCIAVSGFFNIYNAQNNLNSGLLKEEKITTYWNNPQKTIRSVGAYSSSGVSSVGEKSGEWVYYNPYGKIVEISHYFLGKKYGKYKSFYPSGKVQFDGYFFLDFPDSTFSAFYEDGTLAEKGKYAILPTINEKLDTIDLIELLNKISVFKSIKTGEWNYYYEDGKPFETTYFKENDTTEYILSYFSETNKQVIKEGEGVFETFYSSGKPKKKINYKNGIPNGEYMYWNPNGNIRIKGAYTNGQKDGLWTEYFITGQQIYQIINYTNGLKNGEFKEYLINGNLTILGNYKNHMKEGKWEYYFENEQLDMIGPFENGLQNGDWKYYYPNGQLYYEGNFIKGLKNGEWNFNYNTGEKWRVGHYQDDLKNGHWVTFYENKQKAIEGNYKKDKENGPWESWYENGQLKDKGSYNEALMDKIWEGFYKTGQRKYKGDYSLDYKTNKWEYWAPNGKLIEKGEYAVLSRNSSLVGSENRIIKKSIKTGEWSTYSEIDGTVKSVENFNNGKQDGKSTFYYPGGVVPSQEISHSNGILNGKFKTFDRRGNLKSETNYKNNKKHGDMKVFSKRGKIVLHVEYKNGVKSKDVLKKVNYNYQSNKTKK